MMHIEEKVRAKNVTELAPIEKSRKYRYSFYFLLSY